MNFFKQSSQKTFGR